MSNSIWIVLVFLMMPLGNAFADAVCTGNINNIYYPIWVKVEVKVVSASGIEGVTVTNDEKPIFSIKNQNFKFDPTYRPRKYKGYRRYYLPNSDGSWTDYYLIFPTQINPNGFKAFIQQTGHDYGPTVVLDCQRVESVWHGGNL